VAPRHHCSTSGGILCKALCCDSPLSSIFTLLRCTPQVRDFGDLSYLVRGNYEAGMRQLMQRAQPLRTADAPASGLFEVRSDLLQMPECRGPGLENYTTVLSSAAGHPLLSTCMALPLR